MSRKQSRMPLHEWETQWSAFWLSEPEFIHIICKDERVQRLLAHYETMYVNGGAMLSAFQLPSHEVIEELLIRDDQIEATTFFHYFFLNQSVQKAIPAFEWYDRPLKFPCFRRMKEFSDQPLEMRTRWLQLLKRGGAYYSFQGSLADAESLVTDFYNAIFEQRESDFLVFESHQAWNDWFCDVAWDASWVIFDRKHLRLYIIVLTDTD